MATLKSIVVDILKASKTPLTNAEIRAKVQRKRPYTSDSSVDSTLTAASKAGAIVKTPVTGRGKAKNVYSVPKQPSVAKVILAGLQGKAKLDSAEVHLVVQSVRPADKDVVDSTLFSLSKKGLIKKSKTPMTDSNVISSQSKFLYSL